MTYDEEPVIDVSHLNLGVCESVDMTLTNMDVNELNLNERSKYSKRNKFPDENQEKFSLFFLFLCKLTLELSGNF